MSGRHTCRAVRRQALHSTSEAGFHPRSAAVPDSVGDLSNHDSRQPLSQSGENRFPSKKPQIVLQGGGRHLNAQNAVLEPHDACPPGDGISHDPGPCLAEPLRFPALAPQDLLEQARQDFLHRLRVEVPRFSHSTRTGMMTYTKPLSSEIFAAELAPLVPKRILSESATFSASRTKAGLKPTLISSPS